MGTRAGSHFNPAGDDPREPPARHRPHAGSAEQTPASADALGETKVDVEAEAEDSAGQSAPDIDLNEVYDRPLPQKTEDASLKRYDPEAGKMGLAVKIRAVRQQINTPFGRLALAFPLNLASLSLAIYTFAFPAWWLIAATAIIVPGCGWLLWVRYQQWLGHKRYMYRLLETLGEDVTDWNMERTYRKPKVRRAKR